MQLEVKEQSWPYIDLCHCLQLQDQLHTNASSAKLVRITHQSFNVGSALALTTLTGCRSLGGQVETFSLETFSFPVAGRTESQGHLQTGFQPLPTSAWLFLPFSQGISSSSAKHTQILCRFQICDWNNYAYFAQLASSSKSFTLSRIFFFFSKEWNYLAGFRHLELLLASQKLHAV